MATLLIVGAGRLQLPAYLVGRRMGLELIAVDRDPAAPGMALANTACTVDTTDLEGVLAVARRHSVNGVVTLCTDQPVRVVAAIGAALGLPAISPEAAALATNKASMRDAFERFGAPSPRHRLVRDERQLRAALATLGLPAIVKPPSSAGSRGICTIRQVDDISVAFAHAHQYAYNGEVLVEEFVEGPEVSVETLSFAGRHHVIAITDKRTTGEPHWVEMGHVEPSRLPVGDQEAIREATISGLRALGVDNSAGHVEVKSSPAGPKLVEIGARLGGDFISTELALRSTGIDMVEGIIRIALGETPRTGPDRGSAAAIRYFSAKAGRVVAVEGVETARGKAGVVRLEVDVQVGDVVRATQSSHDRPGFVICGAEEAEEAEARSLDAAATVCIRTEPI